MNAALGPGAPAAAARRTQIQHFFPAAGGQRGLGPGCGLRDPPGGPGGSEGLRGAPARGAGPDAATAPAAPAGDEWDDIDDFDLSETQRFGRVPALSPPGQSPRGANPRPEQPPGASPGTGPGPRSPPEHGEASPEPEPRPLSQQSLICLDDLAPCSGDPAAGGGDWENSPADLVLDSDGGQLHPGNCSFKAPVSCKKTCLCSHSKGFDLFRNQRELHARF